MTSLWKYDDVMTWNAFRIKSPLRGKPPGTAGFHSQRVSYVGLGLFTFFWAWQAVDEIVEVLVICDDIMMDTMTWNFAEYISVKELVFEMNQWISVRFTLSAFVHYTCPEVTSLWPDKVRKCCEITTTCLFIPMNLWWCLKWTRGGNCLRLIRNWHPP